MAAETNWRSAAAGGPGCKTASGENFPVGSRLIDRRLRPTVMAYYEVARATDDIDDDPGLPPDEKIRRLERYEAALHGDLVAPDVTAGVSARRALVDAGVPVDMRLYAKGGHAFGMRPTADPVTREWPGALKQWLRDIGML